MGKKGLLKMSDMGYSMPVVSPTYTEPMIYYRNCESFCVNYELDYDSVAPLLPEVLEFSGDVPTGAFVLNHLTYSTLGSYLECYPLINVTFNGEECYFVPMLFVSHEETLTCGREIWGFAKKLADMKFYRERNTFIFTAERPTGNRIVTSTVSPVKPLPKEDWENKRVISLKVIPSAEKGKQPDVCQLVATKFDLEPVVDPQGFCELYDCIGSVTWGNQSNDDQWWRNKFTKITSATYGRFNMFLPHGEVIYDYLNK